MRAVKSLFYTLLVVGSLNSCKKDEPTVKNLPEVTTNSVTNIGMGQAECGGIVISDGGLDIIQRGVCWSTQPNPTIADSITSENDGTGEFKSLMTNLNARTRYYVRAYAKNKDGIAYGLEMEFTTITPTVGYEYGGGIVAYIFKEGDKGYSQGNVKGIIVSLDSIIENSTWGCVETSIEGTSGGIGTGLSNTELILRECNDKMSAASKCAALSVGRFGDWFLPSYDELYEIEIALRDRLKEIQKSKFLWSSTQNSDFHAWGRSVGVNAKIGERKTGEHNAIPARYFSVPK
jgi:hypothetical protein